MHMYSLNFKDSDTNLPDLIYAESSVHAHRESITNMHAFKCAVTCITVTIIIHA